MGLDSEAPKALHFRDKDEDELIPPEIMEDMATAERALQQPILVQPKSRFSKGKAVHVQFDGGSAKGHAMGGFMILDCDEQEVI